MKCKDCDACHKGYFKSKPDDYVCTGVCEPFVIKNINNECTEYKDLKESELWSWNEVDDDTWTHGTFNSREEALNDAICSIEDVNGDMNLQSNNLDFQTGNMNFDFKIKKCSD